MAYLGELYNTEFIEQKGFTDKSPFFDRAKRWTEGNIVQSGNYLYSLEALDSFINTLGEPIADVNTTEARILHLNKGTIYLNNADFNYPKNFTVTEDFAPYALNDYITEDGELVTDRGWNFFNGRTTKTENDDNWIYKCIYLPVGDYFYRCYITTPPLIDKLTYGEYSVLVEKVNKDDNDDVTVLRNNSKVGYILRTTRVTTINPKDLLYLDGNGLRISEYLDLASIYENESQEIEAVEAFSLIKQGAINQLKPFDGYYSVAQCTDYSEIYFKVKATQHSNIISLGNLIAEKVKIEQYRDGEKVGEVEVTPDNRQDKDGVLPKIPVTIMGKLNIADGDTLFVKFSGSNILIGNIETTYMIDDGLTKYAFSVNFIDYNQIKEEFGEIELGNKPIVGRVSLTNIHRFDDAGLLYKRYKNLMKKFVLYDPFDAFVTGKAMDWVVRAFVENAPIKTIGKENEIPETIEVGLSVREII